MPTNRELQILQREKLFDLLEIYNEQRAKNPDTALVSLERQIKRARSAMQAEDISHVEKEFNA